MEWNEGEESEVEEDVGAEDAEDAEQFEDVETAEEVEVQQGEEGEKAGIIRRIRVENFMCHSNLSIDLNPHVNFITGQNGSGKSALLTALCVAFGIRAKDTQRATKVKDFIKTGCNYALVSVEMKNEGEDAFKHDVYGDTLFVERRITASGVTTFAVKDWQGTKKATKKEEIAALVEHFNIEVGNPCVIMTQDKSKEFLHNGSAKDKYKFFFKSTLLQQVNDVLGDISTELERVNESVEDLGKALEPQHAALAELAARIDKRVEMEGLASRISEMHARLAWAWVYDAERKVDAQLENVEKFRERVPICQQKIDATQSDLEKRREAHAAKMADISAAFEDTQKLREEQDTLKREYDQAAREMASVDEDCNQKRRAIHRIKERVRVLRRNATELQERFARETQAEVEIAQVEIERLKLQIEASRSELREAEQQEQDLQVEYDKGIAEFRKISSDLEEDQRRLREMDAYLKRLESQKRDTVTAFGGDAVLNVLRVIEQRRHQFSRLPIGPIGAQLALTGDRCWSTAVEVAVGGLFNSFVVHNQADLLLLQRIFKECGSRASIVIYDIDRPLLQLPPHLLPHQSLTTVMSVIRTNNDTIMNVLIDQGGAERQVLAPDYDSGKLIVFEREEPNVKEVITRDGVKMFKRGNAETILPNRFARNGRLGASVDEQMSTAFQEYSQLSETINSTQGQKRGADQNMKQLEERTRRTKRLRTEAHRRLAEGEAQLRQQEDAARASVDTVVETNTEEIEKDIMEEETEQQGKEGELHKLEVKLAVAKERCGTVSSSLDSIKSIAAEKSSTLQAAEQELLTLQLEISQTEAQVAHFKNVMEKTVLADIQSAEANLELLKQVVQENRGKASQLCSEDSLATEVPAPDVLQTELRRLQQKASRQQHADDISMEELQKQSEKLQKKLAKRTTTYRAIKTKLEMVEKALEVRYRKFAQNARYLSTQLRWNFNGHLRRTGCSGSVKVDYEKQTLTLQVTLPQDSSNSAVKDTRALSGGERSFSTLAFALALHQMTESPFRAMDEFDVFMDDVRRKISLNTVVDFAVKQGSQWIFITPHDISTVEAGPRVKKQQMAAPRA